MPDDFDTQRVTILAVILAILFGILQYIPKETKYDVFGIEFTLFVTAKTVFVTSLMAFLIYLVLLALEYSYSDIGRSASGYSKKFYDIGVLILFAILFIVVGTALVGNIINMFPSFFQNNLWFGSILILAVWFVGVGGLMWLLALMSDYNNRLKKVTEYLSK